MTVPAQVRSVAGQRAEEIDFEILMTAQTPIVFKGLAADWPLVQAGLSGPTAAMDYLLGFWAGRPVVAYTGAPEVGGRFFYDDSATRLNFRAERAPLDQLFAQILDHLDDPEPPSFYVGSTDLDGYLPGLHEQNHLALAPGALGEAPPTVSIWLGGRTTAAAHYDISNNMACCAVGRRRFTLFPPDQVANLYPGPLEPTPGGQVVSMVDFRRPDLERFPRFAEALAHAQVAELEPGDVLVYPALWWHQVEALEPFNALVNYWWNAAPAHMDTPMNTLLHGLLSLRDRPAHEKAGWKQLFDFYVFGPSDAPAAHLPEAARGALGPMDEAQARRLRAQLLNRLNR